MNLVRVRSGLGNQLFQYAFYRELEYRGRDVRLLTSWYKMADCPRSFMLDKFDIEYKLFEPDGERHCCYTLKEDGIFHDPCVFSMESTYLDGYWQSEWYFDSVREQMMSICLKDEYRQDERFQHYLSEIQACESVFVHVRRGDYITDPIVEENWNICDSAYYRNAVAFILQNVDYPVFFFFSNDIDWVKGKLIPNFDLPEKMLRFVEGANEDEAYLDLALMSECRHAILSNSSMSWWGSYLRKQKGFQIAPEIWSRDRLHQGIYRKEWKLIRI